jgi:DNA-directed RNA polymerase sigma subunit (sigma70/sigma32)
MDYMDKNFNKSDCKEFWLANKKDLSDLQVKIIRLKFGIGNRKVYSLENIANYLGIRVEKITEEYKNAIEILGKNDDIF